MLETHILLKYDKNSHFLRKLNFAIKFPQFREFYLQFRRPGYHAPFLETPVKTCGIWTLNNHAKNLLSEDQTQMEKCVLSFLKIPMSARRVGLIWEQHRPYTEPSPTLMLPDDDDDGLFYVNVCSFMYI